MKKFGKILAIVLMIATIVGCTVALTACGGDKTTYEMVDATDLFKEDFGISIKKENTAMMNAVNKVVDEWNANGNMQKYSDYYSKVAEEEMSGQVAVVPEGLKTSWNFGQAGTVTMYTESGFAPYEFIKGGKVVGLDVAIMSQVAENLGCTLNVQDVLFDNISTFVAKSTGYVAGAAGITITDARLETVDFSHVYASSTLVIVSAKGSGLNSLGSLSGKKIGVQQGTSGDIIATKATTEGGYLNTNGTDTVEDDKLVKITGSTVSRYAQYALVYADLQAGRIDAIVMDKLPAQLLLSRVN